MGIRLVSAPVYVGDPGVKALRNLYEELSNARQIEDWARVRHLDRICMVLIDRVITANLTDTELLLLALTELKCLYTGLVAQCWQEVALLEVI